MADLSHLDKKKLERALEMAGCLGSATRFYQRLREVCGYGNKSNSQARYESLCGPTAMTSRWSSTKSALYAVGIAFLIASCAGELPPMEAQTDAPDKEEVSLSLSWTTQEAREHVRILQDLPPSFDEWQTAIFHEEDVRVKLHYFTENIEFTIDDVNRLSITPESGAIKGISITLSPIYYEDFEGALQVVHRWNQRFSEMGMQPVSNAKWPVDNEEIARKKLEPPHSQLLGLRFGLWTDNEDYYAVGIERFVGEKVYDDLEDIFEHRPESTKWAYAVTIGIVDQMYPQ